MQTLSIPAAFVEWLALLHEQAGLVEAGKFRSVALRSLVELFDGTEGVWEIGMACGAREMPGLCAEQLAVRYREPVSGLVTRAVLIRRGRARLPFTAQDLANLQMVMPHLMLAWRSCHKLKLYRRAAVMAGHASALVDRLGHLHVADHRFLGVLRRCWPDWMGSRLPERLCALLCDDAPLIVDGLRWFVTIEDDLVFMSAAPLGALGRLTTREREAALALLAGSPYAVCARQLGISSNTLRNTIARVYRKLGVAGKLELAQRAGFVLPAS